MNHRQSIDIIADDLTREDCAHLRPRLGVRGVIKKANRYLILYYKNIDLYTLPGGGVEECETLTEALKREIKEETGYTINTSEPTLHLTEYFEDSVWEHFFYKVDPEGEPETLNLTELEKAAGLVVMWMSYEEVLEIFSSHSSPYPNSANIYQREFLGFIHSSENE